jgi:FAD/FMN-containing dehydrogenase
MNRTSRENDGAPPGAKAPDVVVETDNLDGVLTEVISSCLTRSADRGHLLHVEAGMKLWQLNEILDRKGSPARPRPPRGDEAGLVDVRT